MATRKRITILLTASLLLTVLSGCAGTMQPRGAERAKPMTGDVYATGDESPADIYRSWYLFNQLTGDTSAEGELRLADLTRWGQDEYRSAYYWYTKAAVMGNGIAAANLWYMYETRSDDPEDSQRALGFYQLAVESDAGLRQLLALETKVAVDSQRHHPAGAAGAQGIAIVEFTRTDAGKASDIRVYRSSGSPELDNAAVEAVQNAELPTVPERLDNIRHFIISVKFTPDIS